MINLFTIPHTGSGLARDLFGGPWREAQYKAKGGESYFSHIYTFNAPLLMTRMEQHPTVITMRHPYLTATSWRKNGKDVGEMCVAYYILAEQLDQYEPHYLPIDAPDRDKYLTAINAALKLDIRTDWPKVNSRHGTDKPDLGDDREQVDRLCNNISPFLRRFYSRKPGGNQKRNSNKSAAKAG